MVGGYGVTASGVIIGVEGSNMTMEQALALQSGMRTHTRGAARPATSKPSLAARTARKPKPIPRPTPIVSKPQTVEIDGAVLRALSEIARAETNGIAATELATKSGIKNPKGLSGLIRKGRQAIAELSGSKSIGKYLWRKRTRDRGAVWYANSQKLREIGVIK